jgi:hypothetical protein
MAAPATAAELTSEQIVAAFRQASSSTGNIADAVEEVTGMRGFMYHDMKPVFKAKIVGQAATALLRPVLVVPREAGRRVVELIAQYDD